MVGVLGLVEQEACRGPAELGRGWRTEVSGTAAAAAKSMSSKPTMARSSGTRSAGEVACWSRPSATRSLAQKTAVGRRGRQAGDALTGGAALGDAQRGGGHDDQVGVGQPGVVPRLPGALEALAHLAQRVRPTDEGHPPVPAVDEVVDREPPAEDVVHRHGAEGRARAGAVHDDERGAAVREVAEGGESGSTGVTRIPCTRCSWRCARWVASGWPGCRCCRGRARGPVLGEVLHPLGDVGEERVGGVEHHVADGPAAPGADWRADSLRTKPRSPIAFSTRARVTVLTCSAG